MQYVHKWYSVCNLGFTRPEVKLHYIEFVILKVFKLSSEMQAERSETVTNSVGDLLRTKIKGK